MFLEKVIGKIVENYENFPQEPNLRHDYSSITVAKLFSFLFLVGNLPKETSRQNRLKLAALVFEISIF